MLATVENMRKVERVPGVMAFSPVTREEASATPGDYFMLGEQEPLLDGFQEPMILVRKITVYAEVDEHGEVDV